MRKPNEPARQEIKRELRDFYELSNPLADNDNLSPPAGSWRGQHAWLLNTAGFLRRAGNRLHAARNALTTGRSIRYLVARRRLFEDKPSPLP